MMKLLVRVVLLIIVVSCNNSDFNNKKSTGNHSDKPGTTFIKDSVAEVSSIMESKITSHSSKSELELRGLQKITNMDSFLLKPFDLYKFKEKAKGSNSSGGSTKPYKNYYFIPSYKGIYYHFFHFTNVTAYKYTFANQNRGNESGLNITTYKPVSKFQYEFLDPYEELIKLESKLNYIDIPELAFIGLDSSEIHQILGTENFAKNNCLVYHYKKRALILGLKENKVNWLRYIHLNKNLTEETAINEIYEMENLR